MDRLMAAVRGFSPDRLGLPVLLWAAMRVVALPAQQSPASPPLASQPSVLAYRFRIDLPDTGRRIRVAALARLGEPPAMDTVAFDLGDAMHVMGVTFTCDDRPVKAGYARTRDQVRVAIPGRSPASPALDGPAETECIRIVYEGEPADGLIIGADSLGRWVAFGDNFPNRARQWLATMDHPSRKAKVTFDVTAPEGRTIVANGVLVATQPAGHGRVLTTWREDRPIPTYGMVIAAAPLAMRDLGRTACGWAEDGGCVPQAVWTAPEQAMLMPGQFGRAGEIVEFFARTIGPYPYEKLGHLQSMTRYGGMENPAAIFYFDRGFRRPNGISDGLIAHETAHQWFGDAVTEREWAHLWLSEGVATFLAALWTQHARGDSAYADEMSRIRDRVIGSSVVAHRAVIDSVETDPNRLLNENSYQKGGFVLRMLRDELGDSAFFAGLRRYYAAHRHGNAMTQDLQRAFEDASGRPLGWFFDQWLRRPGWAELHTKWAWDRAAQRVTLTVEQGDRFGAYRVWLPLDVVVAGGQHLRTMVLVDARASQSIVLGHRFDATPESVTCDPDHALLAVCTGK